MEGCYCSKPSVARKWKLINFDVSTAFLKGEGDGRRLGLEAPPEMAQALTDERR